jgi:outer membrane protein OmpA-like peptidoglycan-associated protein
MDISRFLPKEMSQAISGENAFELGQEVEQNDLKLRTIFFNFNSVRLSNNDRYNLNHSVYIPARKSGQPILIVGYSCDLGEVEEAAKVSLMRAEIVKQYLVNLGMDPERIEVEGIGAPATKLTEAQRLQRRKVDVYHLVP